MVIEYNMVIERVYSMSYGDLYGGMHCTLVHALLLLNLIIDPLCIITTMVSFSFNII